MARAQSLSGRVAIITGAASGIGRASVELFAAEGARVLAVDLPASDIDAAFAKLPGVAPLAQDVTAPAAADLIVDAALSRYGALDILVNNAGVVSLAPVESFPDEVWARAFDVNLNAMFRLCRRAIPALRQRAASTGRGRIINTASIMAAYGDAGFAAYAASKHGVAGFTKALAAEVGQWGITANWILPGAIRTGMTRDLFSDPAAREAWARCAALKRIGEPADIARAALLLAGDNADFITGHGLVVDGGVSLRTGPTPAS